MNYKNETIISFDLETTGLIAGVNSVIEIGAVAYRDGKEISYFSECLQEFPGSVPDTDTINWWQTKQPAQYRRILSSQKPPQEVIKRFYAWGMSLPTPRSLAANPGSFDTSFILWYLFRYIGKDAVSTFIKRHRSIDIRTLIMALFNVSYSSAERRLCPAAWSEGLEITHKALDDAREQGVVLMNILKAFAGDVDYEVATT